MTFLECLIRRYLGQPEDVRGKGVSYWPCPKCSHYSFHTLPDVPRYKHRAKCWNPSCGFRGDAMDIIRHFEPRPYDERVLIYNTLKQQWEDAQNGTTHRTTARKRGIKRPAARRGRSRKATKNQSTKRTKR